MTDQISKPLSHDPSTPLGGEYVDGLAAPAGPRSSVAPVFKHLARILSRAGYASAVWPVRADGCPLSLTQLVLPSWLTPKGAVPCGGLPTQSPPQPLSAAEAPELYYTVQTRRPVLGSTPGPAWLAGLSPGAQAALRPALFGSALQMSVYLPLRSRFGTFGVLGMASREFPAGDLPALAALVTELVRPLARALPDPLASPATGAGCSAADVLEDVFQPLTALIARMEVLTELAQGDDVAELASQLGAARRSAERLVARIDVACGLLEQSRAEWPGGQLSEEAVSGR